jgi:hypothetical protein
MTGAHGGGWGMKEKEKKRKVSTVLLMGTLSMT